MQHIDDPCEPNVWMGDKDSAQMNAIQKVYPNSLYWLCVWHVQQGFNRTGRSKCRNRLEADNTMELLTRMMYTRSEQTCKDIEKKLSRGRNKQLREYLQAEWFQEDEKKKWCMCYRNDIYTNNTHTNNIVESMNSLTKNSFLISMKDQSATELTRVLVTEMIPQLEARYKIDQFTASRHWRTMPTFDLPDLLCQHLPQNILLEIKKEKTKASMIDLDEIIDHGNGLFAVPSTVNPETEVRMVDMQSGRCNCTIVTEKKIVCRHIHGVIEYCETDDGNNYTIENIDIDWFVESHKTDISYGTNQTEHQTSTTNSSNDNTNSNKNSNTDIDITEAQLSLDVEPDETGYDIPLPLSESKQNLQTFNSLRQQLKNIEAHLWDLKRRGNLFKDFRTSGQASELLSQFDNISVNLVNILVGDGDDDEMPVTGFEYRQQQRSSRKAAEKHLHRSRLNKLNETSNNIPKVPQKGRPRQNKQKQKHSQSNDNTSTTNNRPRRTTANYASN